MAGPRPLADGLFTLSDRPSLLGGQCADCEAIAFPLRASCPRCGSTSVERSELGNSGTLYSWTSQGFPPKAPFSGELLPGHASGSFQPWYVGLVELPGTVRVESLLVACTQEELSFGMPLQLVVVPFRTDPTTGAEIVTFAFMPAQPVATEEPFTVEEHSHA